ncbi:MAG: hypothetical protein CVU47_05595 [Chloroflexi bacterium HGW-Chloroflexi-9]|nr:MAG: hypothetical protein CVU47_05595 [Chloroflexi bacterium HGW-Chloroflexi-9]
MSHDAPQVQVNSRAEWRRWLEANRNSRQPVWLVTYRKGHPRHLPYEDIVEEALCFGWIDSLLHKLDAERSALYMSPRKAGGIWARSNKQRAERLEAAGLMTPAGRAVIERAKADGSWSLLDDIDQLVMPPDLLAALEADPLAQSRWEAFSPSIRKQFLWWIKSAKRETTRTARIEGTVRAARENVRVPGKA